MQILLFFGKMLFVLGIYLFLIRIVTIQLADLRARGLAPKNDLGVACLEVLNGTDYLPKGRRFKIESPGLTIGRGKTNDVPLADHFCSVEHANFMHRGGVTILEDKGSTNGTWVNGERIEEKIQLVPGDFIKVGSVTFQYSRQS
ncbi:MAG: FHA domain-containing protein [Peptococcaceae bacterium]|jgi:hypothetical protein|nr:FHA domain-containing protein [Peptococcaceae bacterium]